DEARRQQRQKRLVQGGIAVGIALVAIVALFFLIPRGGSGDQMRQVPLEAANHVEEGAPLTYRNRPPSSGMHYGTVPQASEYRMYDQPLSPGRWVHMLEHGAVAVLYRPDLCDDACVATLGQVWDQAPRSNLVGGIRHLAITPYQNMDHPIAVVAWGYVDEMDQADKDRVLADIKSKMDAPSAPERGAL
ncbi:MAG TPA: DUF3105 domain-containing protein, partial [Chloroflexota bacterium]|nr:DUF3105 domain-containing protein [Chloroflexota bacterium]